MNCNHWNRGCFGGATTSVYDSAIHNGTYLESNHPYKATMGTCQFNKADSLFSPRG